MSVSCIPFVVFLSSLLCVSESLQQGGGSSSIGYYSSQRGESYDIMTNDSDRDKSLLMPVWAYKSAAGYLLFISVMGLMLNIIVVLVLLNDQQKMTPLNWMLLNLACSDGISAGFGAPISIAAAFNSGWPFSEELCAAYAMIISTAGIGSITTLSALAMLRCKLVVRNHVYSSNRFTTAFTTHSVRLGCHKAAILLTIIWSYVLLVTSPPIFGWGNYDREAAHISCSVNWELKVGSNQAYIFYMFTFGLIVPMIVIFVSYYNILRAVRKVKSEIKKGSNLHRSSSHGRRLHQKQLSFQSEAAEKRSTIMVAVMIGAFLIAWTPYSVLALTETFNGKNYGVNNNSISPVLSTVPSLFAKTSSVLNPIIYGFLNTQFKLAWKKMSLRFLSRLGHGHNLVMVDQSSHNPKPFLSSFDTALTITHITVKPSIIYHLPIKELVANGCPFKEAAPVPNNGRPMQQRPQVEDDSQEKRMLPSLPVSPEIVEKIDPRGIKDREVPKQDQPVLLVVVRYVSSSIIHRIHLGTSAGSIQGNWITT